ncbi:MAG TPA: hypothetical protein VHM26_04440 [Chitinophagaceae bacterium]|jgi:hypothetical protein|nr:hypothetical protein [Chitinophagaceae bacterium]
MEKIFSRLNFVIDESNEITKHFDRKELDNITMFCMCMLDRIRFSSEGLNPLLAKLETNPMMDYPAGIIIRSALLDYLIVLNAFEIYGRNISDPKVCHAELDKYCLMMLCDSVRNTMEYFQTLEGQIDKDVLNTMYKNLVAMNSRCFEDYADDGSVPKIKIKEYRSPKQLLSVLMSSKDLKRFKNIYEAYLFYSKYDHFGNMFYGLSRINPDAQLRNLDNAIRIFPRIVLFVNTILNSLYSTDTFISNKIQSTMAFIDDIEGLNKIK